jgi:RNA polymerase sigma-70 factor (ECF subfamily)
LLNTNLNPASQSTRDEDLARQAQQGSGAAFEELVCRYEARIFAFVSHYCRNQEDAQEITQDAFVKAFHAIGTFNCAREFGPWLFTIARRKCTDRLRARRRFTGAPLPELQDPGHTPSELLLREEDGDQLWKQARELLPASQFEALWLRYMEEMNVRQIGQILRKTSTHVKVLLFRGRKALARKLEPARGRTGSPGRSLLVQAAPLIERM